jgi:hypothetical protein
MAGQKLAAGNSAINGGFRNGKSYAVNGVVSIWDLNDNSQLQISSVAAREFIDRGAGRYAEFLPAGQVPGPRSGVNKVIIDSRVSFRGWYDSRR